ncbi:hypothetical protein PS947_03703 [Pseudomonas fluorescens]|nr:hypothetical protein PS947_03703 [Pseudomonas fluorescens]
MDSKQDSQVGVDLQYPRLGSLSLGERARVRGKQSPQNQLANSVKRLRAHSSINRAGVLSPRLAIHRRGATFS